MTKYATTVKRRPHAHILKWMVLYGSHTTIGFDTPERMYTLHLTKGAAHRAARRWTRPRGTPR